jgi:hypothetical protein
MDLNIDQYLSYQQQADMCKYSAIIVCAAAIIIGMKAFDKNLVSDILGESKYKQAPLTQGEKIAYSVLLASGIVCAWCHYNKKF